MIWIRSFVREQGAGPAVVQAIDVTDVADDPATADDPIFRATDRRSAMILLQQVAAHFRRAEPSSPIPLLLDRAEGIAGKDFFGLLREAFPAGSLKVDEQPG